MSSAIFRFGRSQEFLRVWWIGLRSDLEIDNNLCPFYRCTFLRFKNSKQICRIDDRLTFSNS